MYDARTQQLIQSNFLISAYCIYVDNDAGDDDDDDSIIIIDTEYKN